MSSTDMRVGGDGEPHHGVGIGVGLDDARRVGVLGQLVGDAADGVAHVGGGDVEIDAVVELDGDAAAADRTRLDEIDLTPETRATAPSITAVSSRSIGLGGRAVVVGGDRDDRAVDVGQFAHLDAEEGGEAGDHDQRVEHEGEDRPAHEQRRHAGFRVGVA